MVESTDSGNLSMKVLLQPCSGHESIDRYEYTIQKGIPVESLNDVISFDLLSVLKRESSTARIWGFTNRSSKSNNKGIWNKLEEDDIVLFKSKDRFISKAKILAKVENASLAKKLWGLDDQNHTWELVFFIRDVENINVGWRPEDLGYNKNDCVQGARLIDDPWKIHMLMNMR